MSAEIPLFEPTPRKLVLARRRGDVPKSHDLSSSVVLLVGLFIIWVGSKQILSVFEDTFILVFEAIQQGNILSRNVLSQFMLPIASGLALPFIVLFFTGLFVSFIQIGFVFSIQIVLPDFSRINPANGILHLWSNLRLVDVLFSVLKLVSIGYIAFITIQDSMRGIIGLLYSDPNRSLQIIGRLLFSLAGRVGGALLVISLLDYFYQIYRYRKSNRMTREELSREFRELSGDPYLKRRRRRLHQEAINGLLLNEMTRADMLIVGYRELAVALCYSKNKGDQKAPQICAKGQREQMHRLKQIASAYSVPIVTNAPLVEQLFQIAVGGEISEALYSEIADLYQSVFTRR